MTFKLLLVIALTFPFFSCSNQQSDEKTAPVAPTSSAASKTIEEPKLPNEGLVQITFGKTCGMCLDHCPKLYRYNMIGNSNTLFADTMSPRLNRSGKPIFDLSLNEGDYRSVAEDIVENLPKQFLSTKKTTERFGCPDCADECGFYLELVNDGVRKKFHFDYPSKLKGEAKTFVTFLIAALDHMETM